MNIDNKEEMKIVGIFNHKDNYYMMLLNKRCNRFYLKIENNTLCNVTLEEYMDINKTYFSPKIYKGNKTIKIEPLVRFKNKLIALSAATSIMLSMAGCGSQVQEYSSAPAAPAVTVEESVPEVATEPTEMGSTVAGETVTEVAPEASFEIDASLPAAVQDTIKGLSEMGVYVESISPDVDIYKFKGVDLKEPTYQGIDFSTFSEVSYVDSCTPAEFAQYIDIQNPTYDDVRNVLNSNPQVPDDIKEILLGGINNMEAKGFSMDLSVLYYNLQRLNVKYVQPGDLGTCIGIYDHVDGCTYLENEINQKDPAYVAEIVRHEVLGHGSTRAYNPNAKVMCDVMDPYLEIDQQGVIRDAGFLGHFAVEGIADTITAIANDKKIDTQTSSYTTEVYELITLCDSNDIEIEDFANHGIELLIDKMKANGVENPYQTISILDNTTELMMQNALVQADLTSTFVEYYDELEANNVDNLYDSSQAYKDYVALFEAGSGDPLVVEVNDADTMSWINPIAVTNSIDNAKVLSR